MVKQEEKNIKKLKVNSLTQYGIILGILIIINVISQVKYSRLDLTEDKRYLLGDATKSLLDSLDDKVYVKVYLAGDLPAGFRRLKESTKELLDEMRAVSGKKIEYDFVDPLESGNATDNEEVYQQLIQQGLEPINLEVMSDNNKTQKIIFPGAVVFYKNKSLPLKLLKQQIGVNPEEVLHNSILNLEYDLVSTIRKLSSYKRAKIAFIQGHGELGEKETSDIYSTLSEYYDLKQINLPSYKKEILDNFDLIVIAKPDSTFSELEKFKIDQFIVKGGKVLWLVESLLAEMDSLANDGYTSSIAYDLNLNDMFFKYGIKLSYNLVQDLQCHLIPIIVDKGSPQRDFRPWIYYPLVIPSSSHPIVNNLNAIWFRFTNSIDTNSAKNVRKRVLLTSSVESRLVYNPVNISLADAAQEPNQSQFNKGPQILSVLVEGTFNSLFTNRLSPATLQTEEFKNFRSEGKPTKMIFVSDGDIIASQISRIKDQIYPLGYDRFTNQTFGNKTFILNAIDYLLDDSGIMKLRSKQYKLRLLNKTEVTDNKFKWQIINMVIPIIFILIFAYFYTYIRKKRFSRQS